jgi:hypothetical protein
MGKVCLLPEVMNFSLTSMTEVTLLYSGLLEELPCRSASVLAGFDISGALRHYFIVG